MMIFEDQSFGDHYRSNEITSPDDHVLKEPRLKFQRKSEFLHKRLFDTRNQVHHSFECSRVELVSVSLDDVTQVLAVVVKSEGE
jgi:hypothetical protein